MSYILVGALVVIPTALAAQITIPVRVGNVPVSATIGARGVTLGAGGIYARVSYPSASSSRRTAGRPSTSTASRTSGRAGGGTGTSGGASRSSASRTAAAVLENAESYLGVRYTWGGESAREGFDCSGFVQHVFRQEGIGLPRTSREQARVGQPLAPAVRALEPGDLMFFDASGNDGVIDHVAIYAGDDRMIHSSSSGNGVAYDDLSSERGRFFVSRMVTARRVMGGGNATYAYTPQPSVFGWLAKALRGEKPNIQVDAPDWAPRRSR
jgi:cell wall-associated NlpC family hydrolase